MERTAGTRARSVSHRTGGRRRTPVKTGLSFKERLLMQCTVCGVLLALVMVANIVNLPLTNSFTQFLHTRITEDADLSRASGLIGSVKAFLGYEDVLPSNVDASPSGSAPVIINETDGATPLIITEPAGEIIEAVTTETDPLDAIRVDEAMLNEINNAADTYNP